IVSTKPADQSFAQHPIDNILQSRFCVKIGQTVKKIIDFTKFIFSSIINFFKAFATRAHELYQAAICSSSQSLKDLTFFQITETIVPNFLKSTVNSCYCFVRDLFLWER